MFICPPRVVDAALSSVILISMRSNAISPTGGASPYCDVDHLTGATVERLMRAHGKTIAAVAQAMGISQRRVREVRAIGVHGTPYVMDWAEGITGAGRLSWGDVARLYLGAAGRREIPRIQHGPTQASKRGRETRP